MASKVFSGARALFTINGVKVGWATNVSGSEEVRYEPVEVLNNVEVKEYVPVGYECQLSASRVRIVGETLKSQGFFPKTGGSAEEHLKNILNSGDLSCQIEDTVLNKVIAAYEQVKITSHNWSINARGIVAEDVSFVAVRARDEGDD